MDQDTNVVCAVGIIMNITPLEARNHFQHLIINEPSNPRGYSGMGDLSFSDEFYKDAISYYKQAVVIDSTYLPGWIGLTKTYLHFDSLVEADDCIQEALKIDEHHHETLILAASIALKLNKYEECLNYVQEPFNDKKSSYNTLAEYYYGLIKCILRDYGFGLEILKNCLDFHPFNKISNPNYVVIRNFYGVACFKSGKYKEAQEYFQNLVDNVPNCPPSILLNLALVYWIQNETDKSIPILKKIHSMDPKLWPWSQELDAYVKEGAAWLKNAIGKLKTTSPKYDVSIYLGCVIPNRYPYIEAATRHLLSNLEIGVVDLEGASCCPAPGVFRSFDFDTWLTLGARNLVKSEELNRDLLTMCNGCYGTLNDVNEELKHEPSKREQINQHLNKINREFKGNINVRHLLDVLVNEVGFESLKQKIIHPMPLRVAVHYGCHILKPMNNKPWKEDWEDVSFFDKLVELSGAKSIPYKEKMMCCGAGGGVRGAMKEISLRFTRDKLINMRNAGIDAIVVCCPFCQLQFDIGQLEVNKIFRNQIGETFNIPVLYISQLLGLAMGIDPFRMGLLKTPQPKGLPPMQPYDSLFTTSQSLDLRATDLFSQKQINDNI